MEEGAILFYQNTKKVMFTKLVQAVTGCKITHVVIYSKGNYYESTITVQGGRIFSGVRKLSVPVQPAYIGNYVKPLDEVQAQRLNNYLESQVGKLYNILLLLNMIWIYALRSLWKKLKWCPFQNKVFGHICSELVDRAYKVIGIDLIPDNMEEYTTPCDLWRSPYLNIPIITQEEV